MSRQSETAMKIAKALRAMAAILSIVIWFSLFELFDHYDRVNPTQPDVSAGRIYDQQNHGHTVYLTADEKFYWRAAMVVAGLLFGIGVILDLRIRAVERSRKPRNFSAR